MSLAPFEPWQTMRRHLLDNWELGQHATLIGPAGSGKSHLAVTLGELTPHVLVLATKRRDPLISDLISHGYKLVERMEDIPLAVRSERRDVPVHRRVLFWPRPEGRTAQERAAMQAAKVRQALHYAERNGDWAVLIDEGLWMAKNLRLEAEMESLWFQGRSMGVSVITCAQRPSHLPLLAFSQATYLFLWKVNDRRDIERLREISGNVDLATIEAIVNSLDWDGHEFLMVDTRRGVLARSVAPPR